MNKRAQLILFLGLVVGLAYGQGGGYCYDTCPGSSACYYALDWTVVCVEPQNDGCLSGCYGLAGGGRCVADAASNTSHCECYNGNYPDCGQYCGGSSCSYATGSCYWNLNASVYVCVDNSNVDCNNCGSYANCYSYTDANLVFHASCHCINSGTFPDCSGPWCGTGYCTQGQSCYNGVNINQNLCVNDTQAGIDCANCGFYSYCAGVNANQAACTCYSSLDTYPNCRPSTMCYGYFGNQNQYCPDGDTVCAYGQCLDTAVYNASCATDCPVSNYGYNSIICNATSSTSASCACNGGGVFPQCDSLKCGNTYCSANQICVSDKTGQQVCTNNDIYQRCSTTCGSESCYPVAGDPTAVECVCRYSGTYPSCTGVPCNGGYCQSGENCMPTLGGGEMCVSSNIYCSCSVQYSSCVAVNYTDTTCICNSGDAYPNCQSVTFCGNTYCQGSETCVYGMGFATCLDTNYYNSACGSCINNNHGSCHVINSTYAECKCYNNFQDTVWPQCPDLLCTNGYCSTTEVCQPIDNRSNNRTCVDQNAWNTYCSNCNYQAGEMCFGVEGNSSAAYCGCQYSGTPGSCTGPQCSPNAPYCARDEYCQYDYVLNEQVCVNNNYSQFCQNCNIDTGGFGSCQLRNHTATCTCMWAGTYPNCTGQPCGPITCGMGAQCLPNSVLGADPVCVESNKVYQGCSSCQFNGGFQTCVGTIGIPTNFASCQCNAIDPFTHQCRTNMCGNEYCGRPNEGCDTSSGTPTCTCVPPYKKSPMSSQCELSPLMGVCTPCTTPGQQNCGCGAGQVCEVQSSTDTTGVCVCAPGYIFNPRNNNNVEQCLPSEVQLSATGHCFAHGDPHYRTFDGRLFDYQGYCDYILAQTSDKSFVAQVRNGQCGTGVSCTKGLVVKHVINNKVVGFNATHVVVDGTVINSFPYTLSTGSQLAYDSLSNKYELSYADGIAVEYTTWMIHVAVPRISPFAGNMEGLCSNLDGNVLNDFETRSTGQTAYPITFGNSWVVSGASGDTLLFPDANSQCSTPAGNNNPYDFCGINYSGTDPALASLCNFGQNSHLLECLPLMDLSKPYANCFFDLCVLGNQTTVQQAAMVMCDILQRERNATCSPSCSGSDVCLPVAGSSGFACKTLPVCNCGANKKCDYLALPDGSVATSCSCAPGFKINPVDPTACVDENFCGTILCNKTNEQCFIVEQLQSIAYKCECVNNTIRDLLEGTCVPYRPPQLLEGCVPCIAMGQQNCGCADATMNCTLQNPGDETGICQCIDGYVFNQANSTCKPAVVIPVLTPSLCTVCGDPHYQSFDNAYYDHQVKCDVQALSANGVEIHLRQSNCWSSFSNPYVACVKGIAVKYGSDVIEINNEDAGNTAAKLYLNGAIATAPITAGSMSLVASGSGWTITLPDGLVIQFSEWFSVSIQVPATYHDITNGTCGNFDGIQNNDQSFALQSQFIIGHSPLFTTQNQYCCNGQNCPGTRDIINYGTDPNCQLVAVQKCGAVLEVAAQYPECSGLLNLANFYSGCVFDYCALGAAADNLIAATVQSVTDQCSFKTQIYQAYVGTSTSGASTGMTSTSGMTSTTSSGVTTGTGPSSTTGSDDVSSGVVVEAMTALIALLLIIAF